VELDNKLKQKTEIQRRSSHSDWNYQAELKALQARLGEKIDDSRLSQSLVMFSHLELEKKKQEDLGVEVTEAMKDNSSLAQDGRQIILQSLTSWLRESYDKLPEEMIQDILHYLTSDQVMAEVGFHIGLREVVLSEEYPPSAASLRTCLQALIGALGSTDQARASQLVIDLLASQLHGKELLEICDKSLSDPMRVLRNILNNSQLPAPEPRLLFQTGPETILSSHQVGVYCNQELIGQSYGESLAIAEDMAARDALRNIFRTAEYNSPPKYSNLTSRDNSNQTISDYKVDSNIIFC